MGQQTLYNDLVVNGSGVFTSNVQAPNLVYNTGNQSISGIKNFTSIPTVNNTGVLLSGSSYITGISGGLQNQITTLNNQTGSYYPRTNPSGYITGIENIVFTTGDQTISGIKTFSTGVNVTGDVNINGNLTISGQYNVYQQIEKAKILAIAYAIAL